MLFGHYSKNLRIQLLFLPYLTILHLARNLTCLYSLHINIRASSIIFTDHYSSLVATLSPWPPLPPPPPPPPPTHTHTHTPTHPPPPPPLHHPLHHPPHPLPHPPLPHPPPPTPSTPPPPHPPPPPSRHPSTTPPPTPPPPPSPHPQPSTTPSPHLHRCLFPLISACLKTVKIYHNQHSFNGSAEDNLLFI